MKIQRISQEDLKEFNNLPHFQRKLFDLLFRLFQSNKYIPSYSKLCQMIGCSDSTIRRSMKKLESLTMFSVITKQIFDKRTSRFVTTKIFKWGDIMSTPEMYQIYRNLYYLSIILLRVICPHIEPRIDNERYTKSIELKQFNSIDYESRELKKIERKLAMTSDEKARRHEEVLRIHEIIPLTPHGFEDLEKYPIPAIKEMVGVAKIAATKSNPYNYIGSIGRAYCSKNGLKIDYKEYYEAIDMLGIDKDDRSYIDCEKFKKPDIATNKPSNVVHKTIVNEPYNERLNWTPEYKENEFKKAFEGTELTEKQKIGLEFLRNMGIVK